MTTEASSPEATQLLRNEIEAEVSRRSRAASYAAAATVLGLTTIIAFIVYIFLILIMSPQLWESDGRWLSLYLIIAAMVSSGSFMFFGVSAFYINKEIEQKK